MKSINRLLSLVCLISLGVTVTPQAQAKNVLLIGDNFFESPSLGEQPLIWGWLTNMGHTVTFYTNATQSFAGVDAIWMGEGSFGSLFTTRRDDLMSFLTNGGNILKELDTDNVTNFLFGDELTV